MLDRFLSGTIDYHLSSVFKNAMSTLHCFAIAVLLFAGCKHEQSTQPPTTPLKIPQWGMFRHDARHTGNVNTPVDGITGPSRDTIAVAWRTPIDGSVIGSPAIGVDGTIYFGTRDSSNYKSSCFYAINPDGTVKWQYTPIDLILSSPAIGDDGSLYVGARGGYYAFTQSGQLKWMNVEQGMNISSPAISKDGTVYYVTGYVGKDYLKAVDPSTGSLKWQVKGGDNGNSPAIGADGNIYYSNNGTTTAVAPDGNVRWKYTDSTYAPMSVFALEIGFDGTIYFVAEQSPYLYALDSQGKLKWKLYGAVSFADPCLDNDGNIYSVSDDGHLKCIGPDGQLKSDTPLNSEAIFRSPLTIDKNGVVYVGLAGDGNGVSILAYNKTSLLWRFGANCPYNDGSVTASPPVFGGLTFFAYDSGPYYYFYCLR